MKVFIFMVCKREEEESVGENQSRDFYEKKF